MAIVRGAFSSLLKPGLAKTVKQQPTSIWAIPHNDPDWLLDEIELAEANMKLQPDTSKIPRWRQPARRHEAPIKAYRCWELGKDEHEDWILCSVAARTEWEGPVIRSDDPPLDPAVWDKAKREHGDKSILACEKTAHVFCKAGIHAVKTEEQVKETAMLYQSEVYGEVILWGRVAQFELGYRAEYCMIKKLFVRGIVIEQLHKFGARRDYFENIANSLSRRYQCEVEVV